jgi:hypothetical protein
MPGDETMYCTEFNQATGEWDVFSSEMSEIVSFSSEEDALDFIEEVETSEEEML